MIDRQTIRAHQDGLLTKLHALVAPRTETSLVARFAANALLRVLAYSCSALIAASEGRRQEQINIATGEREAAIARSEGEKQAVINKAQGDAASITAVADATAGAIERVAAAIQKPGGEQAVQLQVAEKAVEAYSKVAASSTTTLVVPSDMSQVSTLIASAMKMTQAVK